MFKFNISLLFVSYFLIKLRWPKDKSISPLVFVLKVFCAAAPSKTAFLANNFTLYSVSLSRSPTDRMVIPGSVILTLFISVPPLSITIRYAVIGHLPSSTGAVHFTVSEVAWISVAENMMAGGPGLSRRNLICIIYLYFYSNRVYYTDVLNLTLDRYKDTYLFVPESLKSRLKDQDHGR